MEKIEHSIVAVNGLQMHVAQIGNGPLVLLLHGFPELWYSWRHQMLFLAQHGYRAVAPDLRGYGDTTGADLHDPSKFTLIHLVGDLIQLLDAISPDDHKVFVVGHDWGALVAWRLCLYRPDRVRALVNLSVAFQPVEPQRKLVASLREVYGDDLYICRFQEPGDIEAEFARVGVKEVVKYILSYRDTAPFYFPKSKECCCSYAAAEGAPWLTEEDLAYYTSKFEQTGFTGGINYYRAFDLSWEMDAPWVGAQVRVPAKFVVGEHDLTYHLPGIQDFIHNGGFHKHVPSLKEVVVIQGAAHFINQERPHEINQHIYHFLKQF